MVVCELRDSSVDATMMGIGGAAVSAVCDGDEENKDGYQGVGDGTSVSLGR
jgi:hypothetical protein